MAHYRVSFRVEGKTYYAEGESSYPSDEAIENNDIDMGIALDSAAVIASSYKQSIHLDGTIEHNSNSFEIYKSEN